MNHLANVWVFSDNVERYAELMTGARQWGEKVYAIVQGNTEIDYVKALGADEIVILESHTDLQRVENYAETLASLLGDKNGLLLMAATKRCKALGARLSIQLDAVMVNDATSIDLLDGTLHAEHRMYGGLAFGKEKLNSPQAIITLAPGVLEPAAPLPQSYLPADHAGIYCPTPRGIVPAAAREIVKQRRFEQSQTGHRRRTRSGGAKRSGYGA